MPMIERAPDALARIYARSLFSLAIAEGGQAGAESLLNELEDVMEVARSEAKFGEFLSSRILSAESRQGSLDRIFKGRMSETGVRFLQVLNRKGRLGHLGAIVSAMDELVQESFGRVEVDVYTAAPMGTAELDELRDRLRKTLGREPIVHPYTDRTMIGGIKLQIGDQLIDGSVATKLRQIRDRLKHEGAASVRERSGGMMDA